MLFLRPTWADDVSASTLWEEEDSSNISGSTLLEEADSSLDVAFPVEVREDVVVLELELVFFEADTEFPSTD
jgi:hypothetical protein